MQIWPILLSFKKLIIFHRKSFQGKFEELIAASQEIASSTAQMVVASKVKAKKESKNLSALSSASKKVRNLSIVKTRTTVSIFREYGNVLFSSLRSPKPRLRSSPPPARATRPPRTRVSTWRSYRSIRANGWRWRSRSRSWSWRISWNWSERSCSACVNVSTPLTMARATLTVNQRPNVAYSSSSSSSSSVFIFEMNCRVILICNCSISVVQTHNLQSENDHPAEFVNCSALFFTPSYANVFAAGLSSDVIFACPYNTKLFLHFSIVKTIFLQKVPFTL